MGLSRFVSDDGSAALLLGRPAGSPAGHREIFVFNPQSGALRAVTENTPRVDHVSPLGVTMPINIDTAGITADGRYVFQTYTANTYWQLVGNVQVPAMRTRNEPSYVIDLQTGSRTPIPSRVAALAQAAGVPYASSVNNISADGRYLLMFEIWGDGNTVPFQYYLYRLDRSDGSWVDINTPSSSALSNLAPGFIPETSGWSFSGDGRRVAFYGDLNNRLRDPNGPFGFSVGNVARMATEPYLLDLEAGVLRRIYEFDISQPRSGGSSLGFVRTLGRTGSRFAFDRSGPIAGDPNPGSVARIGWVNDDGDIVLQIPGRQWLRGRFGVGFGHISEDESRVYFIASEDFTGENPQLSNQLFSVEIDGGRIRQITNVDDGGARLLDVGIDLETTTYQSVQYVASSYDHRSVMIQAVGIAGDGTGASATRTAGGRVSISRSTAVVDGAQLVRVLRCSD